MASGLAASKLGLRLLLPQTGSAQADTRSGEMLYRSLGRTQERVSLIGLGGHHIERPQDEQEGIKIIRSAIGRGINFMDNCWDYHNGDSEVRNRLYWT